MTNDQQVIKELHAFLSAASRPHEGAQREDPFRSEKFVELPIELIIAVGASRGYALDPEGNVVGLKLGSMGESAEAFLSYVLRLKKLRRLVLYSRTIESIPKELAKLSDLEVLWFGGTISVLPAELFSRNLPVICDPESRGGLNLLKSQLSDEVQKLLTLELLVLDDSTRTQSWEKRIADQAGYPKLRSELAAMRGIFIDADQLADPPLEIAVKGLSAIRSYFSQLGTDGLPLNELKVMLVGNGGAGKTSLVKRIVGDGFSADEPQTHGINIRDWNILSGDTTVQLHFWDFGGQEIMHATHQFFLSKRSVYILVLDGRKDEDPEYWLQHIESFGGDSPVLVVLNRIDEHPAFEVNRRFLMGKYRGIVDFFRVSCASGVGINTLLERLTAQLAYVAMLQTPWPRAWFEVKEKLKGLDSPYISLRTYCTICTEADIHRKEDQQLLMDFLHDLGVVLHFKDIHLLDTHVLDPRWVTEGVYRLINSELLAATKGYLSLSKTAEALAPRTGEGAEYPPDKHQFIVDLMLKFELCFRVGDHAVLVPDLLDIQEPQLTFEFGDALRFVFEYAYLPKSVMPRFIVRVHEDILDEMRWRTGVMLAPKAFKATALVVADEKAKRILVYVSGDQKRDCFSFIRKIIADINRSFEKLIVVEHVPLPDHPDVAIEYQELLGHERANRKEIFVGRLGKSFDVQKLLNGVERPKDRENSVLIHVEGDYFSSVSDSSFHRYEPKSKEQQMNYTPAPWEKVVVYATGFLFLVVVVFLLVRNEPFKDPNLVVVLRSVLSLVLAIFGATIPGFLKVDLSGRGWAIRAAGAMALFVVSFVMTPTVLPQP